MITADSPSVVVVNDDNTILELMRLVLTDEGYLTIVCDDADQAPALIGELRPDLAIVDVRMPGSPDWHVVEQVKQARETASIPMLVCSAATAEMRAAEARLRAWGCHSLDMPFSLDDLLTRVQHLAASRLRSTA